MDSLFEKVSESVAFLKTKLPRKPTVGVVLGSGLGALVDDMTDTIEIPYSDIPNFPVSSVVGHKGCLLLGNLGNTVVLAMEGRFHYYEGYTMQQVTYPFYVMQQLGVQKLIVTNACGGINRDFEPGTLMLITDFINLMFTNPLIGHNDERFGPRFPDMSEPYSKALIAQAKQVADNLDIAYKEGVYAAVTGPYYETAAEIRAFASLGADAIGMSTVPDTIIANYLGMQVLGVSCITNMATGIQTGKHSHENVVAVANKASADLCRWVSEFVKQL
ncbi:MAG: purine-nucleoside phosphorylase [Oscillospiraceae bacterium]|nr:purine-nucleoside phosphorylase [Oscillospiraceae bacterium]